MSITTRKIQSKNKTYFGVGLLRRKKWKLLRMDVHGTVNDNGQVQLIYSDKKSAGLVAKYIRNQRKVCGKK